VVRHKIYVVRQNCMWWDKIYVVRHKIYVVRQNLRVETKLYVVRHHKIVCGEI